MAAKVHCAPSSGRFVNYYVESHLVVDFGTMWWVPGGGSAGGAF